MYISDYMEPPNPYSSDLGKYLLSQRVRNHDQACSCLLMASFFALSPSLCFLSVCICLSSLSISRSFFIFTHFFLPPSVSLISVCSSPHVCSSSLEENLTVGCNAGCSCVRELYNPVCGADGVMYYSPCHAGCNSINHTDHSTGKQVEYKHYSCHVILTRGKLDFIY